MTLHAKRCSMRMFVGVGLMILSGVLSPTLAQKTDQKLPLVIAGEMPLDPIMARLARVEGVVKIRVTTDGEKVAFLEAESGPPMLVKFAKENIRTWGFVKHTPTMFVTTFKYSIEEPEQCDYSNGASVLNLPLDIRISAKALKTCDAATGLSHPFLVPDPSSRLETSRPDGPASNRSADRAPRVSWPLRRR